MKSTRPAGRRRRQRVFALLTFFAPLLLLLLVEAGLRLFGFGQSHPLFFPVKDAPDYLRANPEVIKRFVVNEAETPDLWIRPVYFRDPKAAATIRIAVQGGSTAAGYPYGYVASPSGMLQQRLQRTFPERKIEVITTAVSAVNSYTLLDFTGEILEHDPDAVVIYAGHNEYVGLLGVGSGYSVGLRRPIVLSFLRLRNLRLFQLTQRTLRAPGPAGARQKNRTLMATIVGEKKIPLGSPLYHRGLEQYRANLRAILRRYRRAGVPVFIGTLVSNERDQPPFTSGHGRGARVDAWQGHFDAGTRALQSGDLLEALAELDQAVTVNDAHAEGHYERGKALEGLARYAEARQAFLAAKDRDELRFRAPEEINRILRQVAAEQDAHIVDVQEALARASKNGIVGDELMLEHLHPNLRGYFLMADTFYEAMRAKGIIGSWEGAIPHPVAWEEIPVSEVDRLYGEYRIRRLTSDWPFSHRRAAFRIDVGSQPIERIAQDYYRGRYEWPEAMRELLDHYLSVEQTIEASKVAVLLAEAFPNRAEDQRVAAELLVEAQRPLSSVYRKRALERASPQQKQRWGPLQEDKGRPGRGAPTPTGG